MQSLEPTELVALGRDHRFGDGLAAVERALAHGGLAVSADFILGVPPALPGIGRPGAGLDRPASRRRRSITSAVYELTIEDRTAFGQRVRDGRLVPLDDDALTRLYTAAHDALGRAGFEHYEISSYARAGCIGRSTTRATGAASCTSGSASAPPRSSSPPTAPPCATNPRRAAEYFVAPGAPAERTEIAPAEMAADRAWLGMRTSDGVPEAALAPARGVADWLVEAGLAERRAGRICPTLRGFLFADRIAARIVQCWDPSDGAGLAL